MKLQKKATDKLITVAVGWQERLWDDSVGKQRPDVHVLDRSVHAVNDTAAPFLLKVAKQVVILPLFIVVITIEADD